MASTQILSYTTLKYTSVHYSALQCTTVHYFVTMYIVQRVQRSHEALLSPLSVSSFEHNIALLHLGEVKSCTIGRRPPAQHGGTTTLRPRDL